MDPHHFGNLDLHPHQIIKKQEPDPHQSAKRDPEPDPHHFADDKPNHIKYELTCALFQEFVPLFES
jgi:hypothetical protein